MSLTNHFVRPIEQYVDERDLNIRENYIVNAAMYLHKRTNKDFDTCKQFVERQIDVGGMFEAKNPRAIVLTKHTPGNREKETIYFDEYLQDIDENKRIVSPSSAVYVHPEQKRSVLSTFIKKNIDKRSESKKKKFLAKREKNKTKEIFFDNEQSSFKISNNSLSGAQASNGTILFNASAHSSLTSTCRVATSYANANNEKFLYGNRHYYNGELVKANITAICVHSEFDLIKEAIEKHNLHLPTTPEVMESIRYSTDKYFKNEKVLGEIELLVDSLKPIERAAFLYTGDLYHLAKYNDEFVRTFMANLIAIPTTPLSIEESDKYLSIINSDTTAYITIMCSDTLKRGQIYEAKETDPHAYGIAGAMAKNIVTRLDDYQLTIKAFWRPKVLPLSIGNIRSSIRHGVVASDTDSTIFSTMQWVKWYTGKVDFGPIGNGIFYLITYLVTQSIIHILATISANMGVEKKELFTLAMKNEYAFPVFALTTMAKTYYAYMSAQEGLVFDEYATEIKGKNLKDGNIPPKVIAEFKRTLCWVMDCVISGEGVNGEFLLRKVSAIENDIINSIKIGSPKYLKTTSVKEETTYSKPESSNFVYASLWNDVFAPKYNEIATPPYAALKVPVMLDNPTAIRKYLDSIEDRELATRFETWLKTKRKTSLTGILLPRMHVESNGIPKELIPITSVRKLAYETVQPFYLLLESLGVFIINDTKSLTRLVSDDIKPLDNVDFLDN